MRVLLNLRTGNLLHLISNVELVSSIACSSLTFPFRNNLVPQTATSEIMSSHRPYVSNPYGPNNHESMPAMLPDEGKKDWRARIRAEMEMRICVWPRSPSPPKQRSKATAKSSSPRKESAPEKHSSMKSKKSEKSSKKDKSEKKKSDRSDKSERSDPSAASDLRAVHFDPEDESKTMRNKVIEVVETKDVELDIQKALHTAMGLNDYERAEIEGFRRDVQGI